jgi:hypothetical protein
LGLEKSTYVLELRLAAVEEERIDNEAMNTSKRGCISLLYPALLFVVCLP